MACARPRYEWLYLYAYVQPQRGEVEWLIAEAVNTALMNESLKLFAKSIGAGTERIVVLAMDRAGWHHPSALKLPDGIHVEYLPSYSPELQPAECLWPLANEPIANRAFSSLQELDRVVEKRCLQLAAQKDVIKGRTNFHWWPPILS